MASIYLFFQNSIIFHSSQEENDEDSSEEEEEDEESTVMSSNLSVVLEVKEDDDGSKDLENASATLSYVFVVVCKFVPTSHNVHNYNTYHSSKVSNKINI